MGFFGTKFLRMTETEWLRENEEKREVWLDAGVLFSYPLIITPAIIHPQTTADPVLPE